MAIFPTLELENVVQVDDRTRLNGLKSFTSNEAAITLVEIDPGDGSGFIDVTTDRYLDWQYATAGAKTIQIRITTDGAPVVSSKVLTIISVVDDKLFSSDEELIEHEDNILNYVRGGRNTFLDKHRAAQDRILGWLDETGIFDNNGDRLTKAAVVDINEVNDWSKFLTLQLIFESLSNAIDDIFATKSVRYEKKAVDARNRAVLKLDLNADGSIDLTENISIRSFPLKKT